MSTLLLAAVLITPIVAIPAILHLLTDRPASKNEPPVAGQAGDDRPEGVPAHWVEHLISDLHQDNIGETVWFATRQTDGLAFRGTISTIGSGGVVAIVTPTPITVQTSTRRDMRTNRNRFVLGPRMSCRVWLPPTSEVGQWFEAIHLPPRTARVLRTTPDPDLTIVQVLDEWAAGHVADNPTPETTAAWAGRDADTVAARWAALAPDQQADLLGYLPDP